ncbi:aminoglycoside 6'-N-acetyltransferase [Clostridium collagenovorans DSM 3089]|uniref:Aminoglycoside 6'-N-acetyltransferase n=1 Tax=Clostridium collagenovorans DSM 3089 TaxID=1121306 RepID=A0A1M5S9Q9_9CLOT|nr:GNAT family N-acetyltransferase [Clostridium collagenovorans]SHH35219.1 aminoglycoside 6'-N-acetyltransferase [Clostridium collagenovorans DSM 3089]
MIFCKTGELTIRSLELSDKQFLVKWLSDIHVLEYYGGRDNPYDENMVEKKFYTSSNKTRCIIEYSNDPIGYIQFYHISKEEYEEYGYTGIHKIIYGTDQFIGETKYWGQGIGTMVMKEMVNFLITEMDTQKIVLDPQDRNKRAISCYEKSGFKKVKILPKHELHEGNLQDCWLMEYNVL